MNQHDVESNLQSESSTPSSLTILLATALCTAVSISTLVFFRLQEILSRPKPPKTPRPRSSPRLVTSSSQPHDTHQQIETHLLIVLGSGGHTAEMLNILSTLPRLTQDYTRRTYLVSSGDAFSACKAVEFEQSIQSQPSSKFQNITNTSNVDEKGYSIVTVRRARRVHQGLLSAPLSTLQCLWDCIRALRGTHPDLISPKCNPLSSHQSPYPDLILTNGPGTGVCVVLAALILLFFGFGGTTNPSSLHTNDLRQQPDHPQTSQKRGQMRTMFIESWARVKTLSLTGKILKYLVNRFLVQWPQLAELEGWRVEYIGPLVS